MQDYIYPVLEQTIVVNNRVNLYSYPHGFLQILCHMQWTGLVYDSFAPNSLLSIILLQSLHKYSYNITWKCYSSWMKTRANIPEAVVRFPLWLDKIVNQPSVVFTQSSTSISYTPEYNNAFTSWYSFNEFPSSFVFRFYKLSYTYVQFLQLRKNVTRCENINSFLITKKQCTNNMVPSGANTCLEFMGDLHNSCFY